MSQVFDKKIGKRLTYCRKTTKASFFWRKFKNIWEIGFGQPDKNKFYFWIEKSLKMAYYLFDKPEMSIMFRREIPNNQVFRRETSRRLAPVLVTLNTLKTTSPSLKKFETVIAQILET